RAKKWKPVFRKPGARTKESTASDDPDLSPDAVVLSLISLKHLAWFKRIGRRAIEGLSGA
ncbi:MAG: hypothetical protein ACLFPA_05730, partial [Dichotomicrobium sp.]